MPVRRRPWRRARQRCARFWVRTVEKGEAGRKRESVERARLGQKDALGFVGERDAFCPFVVDEALWSYGHRQRDYCDVGGAGDAWDDRQLHVQATTERGTGAQQLRGR